MPESPARVQLLAYGAVLVVVLVLGVRALGGDSPERAGPAISVTDAPARAAGAADATPEGPTPTAPAGDGVAVAGSSGVAAGGVVTVHVAGAVRRPGLYRLAPGSRLDDAIRTAGGPTRRADLSAVNLAAPVEDGRQVLVPVRVRGSAAGATAPSVPGDAGGGAPADGAVAAPINLNTATLEQLDTLDGVGPATAQKILDFRAANGGFRSVEELDQIPGIGEKRMAALRPRVTV